MNYCDEPANVYLYDKKGCYAMKILTSYNDQLPIDKKKNILDNTQKYLNIYKYNGLRKPEKLPK